jgi:hypothetical protein
MSTMSAALLLSLASLPRRQCRINAPPPAILATLAFSARSCACRWLLARHLWRNSPSSDIHAEWATCNTTVAFFVRSSNLACSVHL